MEIALDPYLSWDDLVLGSTVLGEAMNDAYRRRHGLHKHSAIEDVRRVCGDQVVSSSYCFAMVRHPVDRACSLYNFVGSIVAKWSVNTGVSLEVLRQDLPRFAKAHPPLSWPASRAFILSRSFDEFLERSELASDDAFKTQLSRLSLPGLGLVCDALKLEEIGTWLPNLSHRLGRTLSVQHENASGQKFVSSKTISDGARSRLQSMFAQDFVAFGYA